MPSQNIGFVSFWAQSAFVRLKSALLGLQRANRTGFPLFVRVSQWLSSVALKAMMQVQDYLNQRLGKANAYALADFVGEEPRRLEELLAALAAGKDPDCRRAAYAFELWIEREPLRWNTEMQAQALQILLGTQYTAIRRHLTKLFAEHVVLLADPGELIDFCFGLLANRAEPVASRAHAMQVLANACQQLPELAIELTPMLEENLLEETPGFRARARRLLKKLRKLT